MEGEIQLSACGVSAMELRNTVWVTLWLDKEILVEKMKETFLDVYGVMRNLSTLYRDKGAELKFKSALAVTIAMRLAR